MRHVLRQDACPGGFRGSGRFPAVDSSAPAVIVRRPPEPGKGRTQLLTRHVEPLTALSTDPDLRQRRGGIACGHPAPLPAVHGVSVLQRLDRPRLDTSAEASDARGRRC